MSSLRTGVRFELYADLMADAIGSGDTALGVARDLVPMNVEHVWASGTGARQANRVWRTSGTLAAFGSVDLNFADGSMTDQFGRSLAFTALRALIVRNTSSMAGAPDATLGITGNLATQIGNSLRPGGWALHIEQDATGIALSAGSVDTLTITNTGVNTTASYQVVAVGIVSA